MLMQYESRTVRKFSRHDSASKKPSTPNTKKRRSGGGVKSGEDVENRKPSISQDESFSIERDCDEIRTKISAYVKQMDVKVMDLRKALQVTKPVYKAFVDESAGAGNGLKNKTYAAAHQFFINHESTGDISEPSPTKKIKTNDKREFFKGS